MDLPSFLAASGLAGVFAALVLGTLFCLVQPIWAIIDCIESDREKDAKVLVSVALLVTWGLGSTLYGLFLSVSRALRVFTLVMLAVLFLLGVGGIATCAVGAFQGAKESQRQAAIEKVEIEEAIRTFRPAAVAADAVEPFPALHFTYPGSGPASHGAPSSVSLADHDLAGPIAASARDVSPEVRHVATSADGGVFALTTHEFGAISPATGRFVEIAVDPQLEDDFSWPKGLAFDPVAQRMVVLTSHVHTRFFRYDPRTSAWERLPSEHRNGSLVALAYSPADASLYALERPHGGRELTTLRRFNDQGASIGVVALDPPIPVPEDLDAGFQLHASSGNLVLIVPPSAASGGEAAAGGRLYLVDREDGDVAAVEPRS